MENATKALLIAASVLIVIVLIAVGIKILSSASGVTNEVGKVSEAMEASIFNSQFINYEGIQTGTQLKELLNKVSVNNRKNSSNYRKINISVISGDGLVKGLYSNSYEIGKLRSDIKITSNYKIVAVDNDLNGYIEQFNILEP